MPNPSSPCKKWILIRAVALSYIHVFIVDWSSKKKGCNSLIHSFFTFSPFWPGKPGTPSMPMGPGKPAIPYSSLHMCVRISVCKRKQERNKEEREKNSLNNANYFSDGNYNNNFDICVAQCLFPLVIILSTMCLHLFPTLLCLLSHPASHVNPFRNNESIIR